MTSEPSNQQLDRAPSAWPGGGYKSAALLRVDERQVARALKCEFMSGCEPGLGRWKSVGRILSSGATIELIQHDQQPVPGFELRVDLLSDSRVALSEILGLLNVGLEVVI
jgi:hypothetical protein